MAERATEYDLLIQARHNAVKNAADMLRAIAEVKRAAKESQPPARGGLSRPGESDRNQGNLLLYDLLQLHFEYVERLAQIQDSTARSPGEFSSACMRSLPLSSASSPRRLVFIFGKSDQAQFSVRNDFACDAVAEISWAPLRGPRPEPPDQGSLEYSIRERATSD